MMGPPKKCVNTAILLGTVVITSNSMAAWAKPQTFHKGNFLYGSDETQGGEVSYHDREPGDAVGSRGHDPGGYYSHSNDNRYDLQ